MKAVDAEQRELLEDLMKLDFLDDSYLAGGTNLALRFGHRKSIDLDIFVQRDFDIDHSNRINFKLKETFGPRFTSVSVTEVGVFGSIDGIKTDFVNYPHNLLKPLENLEGARLASTLDVAAMKINAVIGRGTQKDFYDINELLKHFALSEMFDAYQDKYKVDNTAMAERSLLYFEDAKDMQHRDNQVVVLNSVKWKDVELRLTKAYQQLRNERERKGRSKSM